MSPLSRKTKKAKEREKMEKEKEERNGASTMLSNALIWSPEEVSGVPVVEILLKFSPLEEGVGERPAHPHRWVFLGCTLVRPEHERVPEEVAAGHLAVLTAGVVVGGQSKAAAGVVLRVDGHSQEVCEGHVVPVGRVSVGGSGGGGLKHGVLGVPVTGREGSVRKS